jgi:hypothetical protein
VPEYPSEMLDDVATELLDGRLSDLPRFVAWLAARGILKQATAQSYQTAVTQIIATVHGSSTADSRTVDVDRWCRAFAQKRPELSDTTRDTYVGRFRRAVEMYRDWLASPDSVRVPATRDSVPDYSFFGTPTGLLGQVKFRNLNQAIATGLEDTGPDGLVPHPFPLTDGRTAYLLLPYPLTTRDVERLSHHVLTLATDLPSERSEDRREVRRKERRPNAPRPQATAEGEGE